MSEVYKTKLYVADAKNVFILNTVYLLFTVWRVNTALSFGRTTHNSQEFIFKMTKAVLHEKTANCSLIWKLHRNCNEVFEKGDYTVLLSVVVVVAVKFQWAPSCMTLLQVAFPHAILQPSKTLNLGSCKVTWIKKKFILKPV